MQPTISIITPVFNSQKYIKRFFNNFNQANKDKIAELIFIDDGSTDNTPTIINELASTNDNVKFYKQDHQYQSAARNLGMSHASGKYFLFLDVDDTFSPELFTTMLKNIQDYSLVICGINRVLSNNTLVLNNSVLEGATTKDEIAKKFLLNRDQMDSGLWNKIFRADIIQQNHLSFSNKNFVEDILFVFNYLMCINANEIKFVHKALYTYYQNSNTTTTSYYPELDGLADSYISQVSETLQRQNISDYQEIVVNTAIRTQVYVIHRHILGDRLWNAHKQKEFLNRLTNQFKNSQELLPTKYKLGLKVMKIAPNIYIKLYRLYKHVH